MQDTYVCGTCANARDTNPGTQTQPVRTIARGIQLAQTLSRPTVFVGTAQGVGSAYAEAIVVPAGITVQGRWVVSGTFSWARSFAARTLLTNTSPLGVTFAAGATRSAGLDGMRIRASGGISGSTGSVGISIIDASPLILDTDVEPPVAAPTPITAAGISISRSGPSAPRPNPRIAGISNATRATVAAGAAVTNSIGIIISDANVEVEFVDTRSNTVSGTTSVSSAIQSNNAAGTQIRNSSAQAGVAQLGLSSGIAATGDVGGLEIQNVDARGCTGVPGGMTSPAGSFGIGIGSCTNSPGGAQPRVTASLIQGGLAQGNGSYAVGIVVTNGCSPQLDNNRVTGSVAVNLVPQSAAGIACTHEPRLGVPGLNSACRVVNNQVTAGRAVATSLGLSCIGNCASSDAACLGSCGEVTGNTFSASDAPMVYHGFVLQSAPRIAKNTFGEPNSFCTQNVTGFPSLTGLHLEASSSRVENNVIVSGACATLIGIQQVNVRRAMGVPVGPDVHSNTVNLNPASSGLLTTAMVGVSLRSPVSGPSIFPPTGTYRNNILAVSGFAQTRLAFREENNQSDPAVLENNNFWVPTPAGMPTLYLDEGAVIFVSAAQINMLNAPPSIVVAGSLSLDPGFLPVIGGAAQFRLSFGSQMRGAGTPTGMPRDDFDSTIRPLTGNTPDIGADEVQ
jgi:hypothetical protein